MSTCRSVRIAYYSDMSKCEACDQGDHANCGLKSWCDCDCDPFADDFCDNDLIESVLSNDGPRCYVCGCTESHACEGGCIWANSEMTLCSRCAIERN